MLKWSILKPTNGWEIDDSSSLNIIKQLLLHDTSNDLPNLVKVKFLSSNHMSPNVSIKSSSPKSIKIISDVDSSLKSPSVSSTQQDKDDIWLILHKYVPNYALVYDSETSKRFSIPFEYDGLFTPVINGKKSLKIYKFIKDMEIDLKRDNKIIVTKSCVGFTILETNETENIKNSRKKTLYKVHKIDEGSILKFDKYCYIETNKCLQMGQENSLNVSESVGTNNESLKDSSSTLGRKSIFTAFFSNILSNNTYSGSLNSSKLKHTSQTNVTQQATTASIMNQNNNNNSNNNNNKSCFCTGINPQSLSPSYYNKNRDEILQASPNRAKKKSKIIRVIKCFHVETNAILYIKDSCQGEFLIYDDYFTLNETQQTREISCKYLYDMKSLVSSKFASLSSENVELELVYRKSTKFNRLPFTRIRLQSDPQITCKPSIIIYDVNKNKFFEYFLSDLANTRQYQFFKASKDSDLILKYKAKLDWCLTTLNEFKYDVKVVFNLSYSNTSVFFEQFNFRTYSRRNFRRRTTASSSMPTQNKIKSNHASIFTQDEKPKQGEENLSSMMIETSTNEPKNNNNSIKKIIKFATTSRQSIPILNKNDTNDMNMKKTDRHRSKLSSLFTQTDSNLVLDSKASLSNELASDKAFVTVINIKRKDDTQVVSDAKAQHLKRSPTSLIDYKTQQIDDKFVYNIKYLNKKTPNRPSIFNSFKFANLSEFKLAKEPVDDLTNDTDHSKQFLRNLMKVSQTNSHDKILSNDFETKSFEITAI